MILNILNILNKLPKPVFPEVNYKVVLKKVEKNYFRKI
jgi:hypothetical protein